MFHFLSYRDSFIGKIDKVTVCANTASYFKWKYNEDGWNRSLDTVIFTLYSNTHPDELIGSTIAEDCVTSSLKGYFYNNSLSKYDSLVEYSRDKKQYQLYKDIFSLK